MNIALLVIAVGTVYSVTGPDGVERFMDRGQYEAEVEQIRQDVRASVQSGRVQPAITGRSTPVRLVAIPPRRPRAVQSPLPPIVTDGGVRIPKEGFGERQLFVASTVQDVSGPSDRFAQYVGAQLPPSDRARWWIILYVDQAIDMESERLVRDFNNHKGLKMLGGWAKLFVIDKGVSPAAEARYAEALALQQSGRLPAILVCANPEDPVFGVKSPKGWKYAFQGSGYGGDADLLARNLYQAIREQYLERGVSQCPGPYCPDEPDRRPDRQPDPYPGPNPSPYRPNNPRQPVPFQPIEPPPRMDEPQIPRIPGIPNLFQRITWTHVLIVVGIGLGLSIANRKGWLEPGEEKATVAGGKKDAK